MINRSIFYLPYSRSTLSATIFSLSINFMLSTLVHSLTKNTIIKKRIATCLASTAVNHEYSLFVFNYLF